MRILRLKLTFLIACLALSGPTWSNGDLFFFWALEIPGHADFVLFGNVRDETWNYLQGAIVTVRVFEPNISYSSEAGLLGGFRTVDLGRVIRGLGYDVDASRIDVSAEYPGYHVVRRLMRAKYGQNHGAVEVNFVMAKNS